MTGFKLLFVIIASHTVEAQYSPADIFARPGKGWSLSKGVADAMLATIVLK